MEQGHRNFINQEGSKERYNIPELIEELKLRNNIPGLDFSKLMQQTEALLKNQPNTLTISSPVYIFGDIHGQFYDLVNEISTVGYGFNTQLLFLGDYVDRGKYCIEVITLLMALKVNYPSQVHLLRGNHQGRNLTSVFNFKSQTQKKYNQGAYARIIDLFQYLPLAAVIDNKYFAVHAGISPNFRTVSDIQKLNRVQQIGNQGVMCDLVWSDPKQIYDDMWKPNSTRACSYFYTLTQATQFLRVNKLKMIIRGHEIEPEGYKQYGKAKSSVVMTVFSAPNYGGSYNNKAAVLSIQNSKIQIKSFTHVEQPFVLGNYLNVFQWSIPIVSNATCHLLSKMLSTHLKRKRKSTSSLDLELQFMQNVSLMGKIMNHCSDSIESEIKQEKIKEQTKITQNPFAALMGEGVSFSKDFLINFAKKREEDQMQKVPQRSGPSGTRPYFQKIQVKSLEDVPLAQQTINF